MHVMGTFLQSPKDESSGTEQIPNETNFDPITSPPTLHQSARFQSVVHSKRQTQPPMQAQLQRPKQAQLKRPNQAQPHTITRSQLRNYCEVLYMEEFTHVR